MSWIGSADRWVVEQVQTLQTPALDAVFRAFSGLPLRIALVVAAIGLVSWSRRSWQPALAAVLAIGLALLVNLVLTRALKDAIGRARPSIADPSIHPLVPVPDSPSFPSGHASSAFAVAAALALFVPGGWRWALFAIATLIAFSRIWLGVHYSTDVVAGAALGTAVGYLAGRLVQRWFPLREQL